MNPQLNDAEKKMWDEQGWSVEGAAHVDATILATSLKVAIGRAATIIAQCKGTTAQDDVELALGGDVEALGRVSARVHLLPWVALRNGKPDGAETRLLVEELAKRPGRRSLWHGLLVVSVSNLKQSVEKLSRCPLTGHILDDHEGKLVDGETGADWAPLWPGRGNGRALWLAHARRGDLRSTIPGYVLKNPRLAVEELSAQNVPVQWQRAEQSWTVATVVEQAQAEEALFSDPREMLAEVAPQAFVLTSRTALRQRLMDIRSASMFDAFVQDNWFDVYRRFSGNMDRSVRINLLFECVDLTDIANCLREM